MSATRVSSSLDVVFLVVDVVLLVENSAVFQAQVGEQVIALSRLGYRCALACVIRDRPRFDAVIGRRLADAGVAVVPMLPPPGGFLTVLRAAARAIADVRRARDVTSVYVRGLWGPVILALAGRGARGRYVYDVRGQLADEMRAVGTSWYKQRAYLLLERWGIGGASAVSAVSAPLAALVRQQHPGHDVAVVPSSVDVTYFLRAPKDVAAVRAAAGIHDDDVVFVYAGGLSHYQQIPAMLQLWSHFLGEPGIAFVLLTNDNPHSKELAIGDLGAFGSRLRHLSVSRDDVATWLAASDIGFALRDARTLNATASPVKYAEYAAAGLAVVGSPGTGDASDRAVAAGVGVPVDPADVAAGVPALTALVQRVRRDRQGIKDAARALALRHYDWSAHAPVFRALYGPPSENR
jgi:glycosyltransferase involved in cell wall biosynthesis